MQEMAELNEPRPDGEVATQPYDQNDQDFSRQKIIKHFKHERILGFLLFNTAEYTRPGQAPVQGAHGSGCPKAEQFRIL
ncbi:hypothetical protein GCM10009304_13400 [Pseudomonas matsuisoli]|uniref:Uncharacterized protein n=1 Tax=Pseudomonas matsuisoli TaxID=1515666 RepID=A0A917PSB1_9PSED|nr:hypothetical protein GCM10009304_13400 [Pseudomonas matsuisoli]